MNGKSQEKSQDTHALNGMGVLPFIPFPQMIPAIGKKPRHPTKAKTPMP